MRLRCGSPGDDAHEAGNGASRHFDRLKAELAQRRIIGIGWVALLIA
jgi:hypothetical protein